jgi:zinc protease
MKSGSALILTFALITTLSFSQPALQPANEFTLAHEKYELANGLDVVLHEDHSDPIAAVFILYRVGSNRETQGKTGFAHLFEHIMFQQSQHVAQDQFHKKIQAAGGTLNGMTSYDHTMYYDVVPKNALEMALWLEADRMGYLLPTLTQEAFENQQNVVQNEKRQRVDNVPYGHASYVLNKVLYPERHPYNWQVIGSLEDLGNASLHDVVDFYTKFYGPHNATLVVTGDIEKVQTKAWIEKYFGDLKGGKQSATLPKMPVTLTETKRVYYEDNFANAPSFSITFPTVEQYHPDSYALDYLADLFAGSKKSPLYKILVEEKKLAPSVSASQSGLELAGTFSVRTRTFPDKNLTDVQTAVAEAFARFEQEGFTEKDLARLKTKTEIDFYNSIQGVLGKAQTLGGFSVFAGSPNYLSTHFKNSLNVTKDDIWRVYNKYVKGKHSVMLSIVPKGKANLVVQGSQQFVVPEESLGKQGVAKKGDRVALKPIPTTFDRTQEPPKGPAPIVTPPPIWSGATKNGIRILGITRKEIPLVYFTIVLRGGMLLDPKGKIGVASLTADMMKEGTKTKTPVELKEAIQDLGATINVESGSEHFWIAGNCLASRLDATIALAKEMMLEPRWDEKEFALVKAQAMQAVRRRESSPPSIAQNVFRTLIYGSNNLLSHAASGSARTLEAITLNDVKEYYSKYFSSKDAVITLVGDIDEAQAVKTFNTLNDWRAIDVNLPDIKVEPYATKSGVYFVDVPNAKQSELMIGHSSLARTDPDYFRAVVMNHKLGGSFGSFLNMLVREEKGYTYSIGSSFSGTNYPGMFTVSTSVQTNATFESLQIIRDQIAKYRNGISEDDLISVKNVIRNGEALRYETLGQLSSMMNPIAMYGIPLDYVKRNQETLQRMTVDEIKSLAQKHLLPDKMIYLVVGDKATQFEKLKDLGLGNPIPLDKEGKAIEANKGTN